MSCYCITQVYSHDLHISHGMNYMHIHSPYTYKMKEWYINIYSVHVHVQMCVCVCVMKKDMYYTAKGIVWIAGCHQDTNSFSMLLQTWYHLTWLAQTNCIDELTHYILPQGMLLRWVSKSRCSYDKRHTKWTLCSWVHIPSYVIEAKPVLIYKNMQTGFMKTYVFKY